MGLGQVLLVTESRNSRSLELYYFHLIIPQNPHLYIFYPPYITYLVVARYCISLDLSPRFYCIVEGLPSKRWLDSRVESFFFLFFWQVESFDPRNPGRKLTVECWVCCSAPFPAELLSKLNRLLWEKAHSFTASRLGSRMIVQYQISNWISLIDYPDRAEANSKMKIYEYYWTFFMNNSSDSERADEVLPTTTRHDVLNSPSIFTRR